MLDCSNIQTTGRLNCNQKLRILVDLTGNDCFLLVSTRHGSCLGDSTLTGTDIVLFDQAVGISANLFAFQKAQFIGELWFEISLKDNVVFQGIIKYQAMLVTVFRDMAHAGGKALTDWHVSNVFSIHSDSAALQWLQAGKSINKFGLAISVDSGDTYDLTSVDLKRNAVDCVILMMLGSNHHILDIQNNFTGLCFFFLYNEVYVSSNHHGGKFLRVGIPDVYGSDAFSLTKNGTAVCNLHDLTKLVGNEQNAFALGCQIFHDLHKLLDFLRSKYCGRLIKDQDLVVTVKHFQDLGSLLHTYCGILDNGIRIYRKTIFFGKGHNLFTRALFLKETVFCGLNTKDNVIQNAEAFY